MSSEVPQLVIVIPVYNECDNILRTLDALVTQVHASFRVLICYDFEEDDTLPAIRGHGGSLTLSSLRTGGVEHTRRS